MKRIALSMSTLLLAFSAFAQVDQEAIFMTGGLNFSTADVTMDDGTGIMLDAKANDFTFNLGGGYMLTDMFGAGLRLGYSSQSVKAEVFDLTQSSNSSVFQVAPFLRTYIEIDEPLYALFDLQTGFGFGKTKTTQVIDLGEGPEEISYDQNFNVLDINISPGLTYFLSDNFALEMWYGYIGYYSTSQKVDDGTGSEVKVSQGQFMFNADFSTLRFGILYMFNN